MQSNAASLVLRLCSHGVFIEVPELPSLPQEKYL